MAHNIVLKDTKGTSVTYNNVSKINLLDTSGKEVVFSEQKTAQTKTITPTTSEQSVTADTGYELTEVKVGAIQTEEVTATENGEYTSSDGKYISKFTVDVAASSGGGDDSQLIGLIEGTATEFNIPEGITTIKEYLFYYMSTLKTITIPSTVTKIKSNAFSTVGYLEILNFNAEQCTDFSTSNNFIFNATGKYGNGFVINVGENVKRIPAAFMYPTSSTGNAPKLIGLNFAKANACTEIGSYAFGNGSNLSSIELPNALTSIGTYAFSGCSLLESVTIPIGVTSLPTGLFSSCSKLSNIVWHNNISNIGIGVFNYCKALSSLVMPSALTAIGANAFNNCTNILKYDFTNCVKVPTLSNTNTFTNINAECKIYVPDALYDEWIVATNWSTYASYIVKASEMPTE